MIDYIVTLSVDSKSFTVKVPFVNQEFIKIENFSPLPDTYKGQMFTAVNKDSFAEDIKNLLPKTLQGSPFDNTVYALYDTIGDHLEKFGRIMPGDLYTYINEAILIIFNISEQLLNQKVPQNHGYSYFETFFKIIWEAFNPEMRQLYIKCGEKDPITLYLLNKIVL
jgi:hypothetical protein